MKVTKRRISKWVRAYWEWQRLAKLRGEAWAKKHAARLYFLQCREEIVNGDKTRDGWDMAKEVSGKTR